MQHRESILHQELVERRSRVPISQTLPGRAVLRRDSQSRARLQPLFCPQANTKLGIEIWCCHRRPSIAREWLGEGCLQGGRLPNVWHSVWCRQRSTPWRDGDRGNGRRAKKLVLGGRPVHAVSRAAHLVFTFSVQTDRPDLLLRGSPWLER